MPVIVRFRQASAVTAALLVTLALGGCASVRTATQSPSESPTAFLITPDPEQPCPGTRPSTVASTEISGANSRLVPFTPTGALICQYGPADSGLVSGRALDSMQAATLSEQINAAMQAGLKSRGNTGYCLSDNGRKAEVFAWDAREAIQIEIDMAGCQYADNGSLRHAYVDNELTAQIDSLARTTETTSPTPAPTK